MTAAAKQPFTVKGRHVLVGTLLFFGVVIGLDSLFVTWAVKSWPGEVSETAYEDGLAYNRTIEARAAQASLGWTAKVEQAAEPGAVRVRFADADGAPLGGLEVEAAFTRPATDKGASRAKLRTVAPGLYAGAVEAGPGAWDVTLTATDAQGRSFTAERRLAWR